MCSGLALAAMIVIRVVGNIYQAKCMNKSCSFSIIMTSWFGAALGCYESVGDHVSNIAPRL